MLTPLRGNRPRRHAETSGEFETCPGWQATSLPAGMEAGSEPATEGKPAEAAPSSPALILPGRPYFPGLFSRFRDIWFCAESKGSSNRLRKAAENVTHPDIAPSPGSRITVEGVSAAIAVPDSLKMIRTVP